jgi:hypothetical protein
MAQNKKQKITFSLTFENETRKKYIKYIIMHMVNKWWIGSPLRQKQKLYLPDIFQLQLSVLL